jgi:predicted dinucleotide-binding enzyme
MSNHKIGILGSGAVAKALGAGFIRHGRQVMLGTREAGKLADWAGERGAYVGSFADAAAFGDLLVLAVAGRAAIEALEQAGEAAIKGKIVIDPTNPIEAAPPVDGVLRYFTGPNESLMERLQARFPEARFVKAFSSVSSARMVNPEFPEGRPTMFICGDDAQAKEEVRAILDLFGWETGDFGGVKAARAIEPLAMLYCIPGFRRNHWTHAFKVFGL